MSKLSETNMYVDQKLFLANIHVVYDYDCKRQHRTLLLVSRLTREEKCLEICVDGHPSLFANLAYWCSIDHVCICAIVHNFISLWNITAVPAVSYIERVRYLLLKDHIYVQLRVIQIDSI